MHSQHGTMCFLVDGRSGRLAYAVPLDWEHTDKYVITVSMDSKSPVFFFGPEAFRGAAEMLRV